MICQECKDCWNYKVCEVGCYGSDKPCEYYYCLKIINEHIAELKGE